MIDQHSALLKALAAAALLGAGVSALTGCAAKASAQSSPAVAVEIARAGAPGSSAIYRGPASAAATHTYRVGFEVGGRVINVNADVGDRVAAGTVLASIDAADARAQLSGAQARAAAAQAQLAKLQNGARPQEREQAGAVVEAARANLGRAQAAEDLARANDHRYQTLLRDGDVSRQQADSARTALLDAQGQVLAAQAQLAQAEQGASLVVQGARAEDRRLAEADAQAASAAADQAATLLRKTSIVAPADAFVVSRSVEPGDQTSGGSIAFVLVDAARCDVLVDVPEALAGAIARGTPAVLTYEGRRYSGRVSRIEPSADAATRTLRTRIVTENLTLRPGTVVDAAIGEHALHGASVPAGAVVPDPAGSHVLVFDAARSTVSERTVHVVQTRGEETIVSGVRPGERIVIAGQYSVHPGDAVRVVSGS